MSSASKLTSSNNHHLLTEQRLSSWGMADDSCCLLRLPRQHLIFLTEVKAPALQRMRSVQAWNCHSVYQSIQHFINLSAERLRCLSPENLPMTIFYTGEKCNRTLHIKRFRSPNIQTIYRNQLIIRDSEHSTENGANVYCVIVDHITSLRRNACMLPRFNVSMHFCSWRYLPRQSRVS